MAQHSGPRTLESLPRDIRHSILHSLHSFRDLHALILASPNFAAVYRNSTNSICKSIALRYFLPEAFKALNPKRPGWIPSKVRDFKAGPMQEGFFHQRFLMKLLLCPELKENPELNPDPEVIRLAEVKQMLETEKLVNAVCSKLTENWKKDIARARNYGDVWNPGYSSAGLTMNSNAHVGWFNPQLYHSAFHGILAKHNNGGASKAKDIPRTLYKCIELASAIYVVPCLPYDPTTFRLEADLMPLSRMSYNMLKRQHGLCEEMEVSWPLWSYYRKSVMCIKYNVDHLMQIRERESKMFALSGHEYPGKDAEPALVPHGWEGDEMEYVEVDGKTILVPKLEHRISSHM